MPTPHPGASAFPPLTLTRAGRLPDEPPAFVVNEAAVDPSRVPDGKSSLKIILTAVPYAIDWSAERLRSWA